MYIGEAVGLAALRAFEVDVVVVVVFFGAVFLAEGIAYNLIFKYFMDKAFFKECLEGAIDRNAVETIAQGIFDITMWEGYFLVQKSTQDILPAGSTPQVIVFEGFSDRLLHATLAKIDT